MTSHIYYAKISLITKTCYKIVALQTFGADQWDARGNVEQLLEKWQDVKSYEILKIAPREIFLRKYVVIADIKYTNGRSKLIKINLKCETPAEAKGYFKKVISSWKYVAGFEVKSINERD